LNGTLQFVVRRIQSSKVRHCQIFYDMPLIVIVASYFRWNLPRQNYPSTGISHEASVDSTPDCNLSGISIFNVIIYLNFQPNGRFELNKKICLSISGYHPESWQPSWSSKFIVVYFGIIWLPFFGFCLLVRTALLAIIGFMPTPGIGALGALDYTPEERKTLAQKCVHRPIMFFIESCRQYPFLGQRTGNVPRVV